MLQQQMKYLTKNIKDYFSNYDLKFKLRFTLLLIIVGLILLDFTLKIIALKFLIPGREVNFLPGFIQIELAFNKGAAFGIGSANPSLILGLQLTVALLVLVFFFFIDETWYLIGFSLIFSGAIGNLLDRFANITNPGTVVDYLSWVLFRPYSIFNFADMLVVIGTVTIIISLAVSFIIGFKEK